MPDGFSNAFVGRSTVERAVQAARAGITIEADLSGYEALVQRLSVSLSTIGFIAITLKKYAELARAQAVRNVSGDAVTFSGGTFVINRYTGKLARSINVVPGKSPLSIGVRATAEYADAVEGGRRAVDMKPHLMGKTVPIRVSGPNGNRAQYKRGRMVSSKGPIAFPVRGNSNQDPEKTKATKVQKLTTTGKKAGVEWIIFRKVTANSTGWIIPPRPPKPFMQAAAEWVQPQFQQGMEEALQTYLDGGVSGA